MKFLDYKEYIVEAEKVSLDKDLREYTLTHVKEDRFTLKSNDFYKEFSVLPYKKELLEKFKSLHYEISKSLEKIKAEDLYALIDKAENLPYTYGNIFTSKFTLSSVPDLATNLDPEQQRMLASSEREFLLNNFSQLDKSTKTAIIESLRERAEIICCVVEALFYYVRTIDKDNFYNGMSSSEIVEEYEKHVKKSSKEENFSFSGPYDDTEGQNSLTDESRTAFWRCEKDMKKFFIQATVNPKELYSEENVGGTTGLKFSLLIGDKTPMKEYAFFNIEELSNRIESFYKNILKKKR